MKHGKRKAYLGVAQFGSVLEWGSRGRRFESSHPDVERLAIAGRFFIIILIFRFPAAMLRVMLSLPVDSAHKRVQKKPLKSSRFRGSLLFDQNLVPHSGQNLGLWPSAGLKPQFTHFSSSGLAEPQLGQNLVVLVLPQVQFQLPSAAGCW